MKLYVNGQDIAQLVLGIIGDEGVKIETFAVPAEGFLKTLDSYLRINDLQPKDIQAIIFVKGPGSPTSLRIALSIVNSLHFALRIPLVPIEKDPVMTDEEVLTAALIASSHPLPQGTYATPVYMHAPRITVSTKDALGR